MDGRCGYGWMAMGRMSMLARVLEKDVDRQYALIGAGSVDS